jgi:hypothetical protein
MPIAQHTGDQTGHHRGGNHYRERGREAEDRSERQQLEQRRAERLVDIEAREAFHPVDGAGKDPRDVRDRHGHGDPRQARHHLALKSRLDLHAVRDVEKRAEVNQHATHDAGPQIHEPRAPEDALDRVVIGGARLGDLIFGGETRAEIEHAEVADERPHQIDDPITLDTHQVDIGRHGDEGDEGRSDCSCKIDEDVLDDTSFHGALFRRVKSLDGVVDRRCCRCAAAPSSALETRAPACRMHSIVHLRPLRMCGWPYR